MSDDTNKQVKKYPVREGTEQSSILHDKEQPPENTYPRPEEKDKQVKNQPEFTEEQPNKKTANNPS